MFSHMHQFCTVMYIWKNNHINSNTILKYKIFSLQIIQIASYFVSVKWYLHCDTSINQTCTSKLCIFDENTTNLNNN